MTKYGTADTIHPQGGPSPQELARREAADREARERGQSWQTHVLDALTAAQVLPADLPARQEELDRIALDAMRHAFGAWTPPNDGRPLIERVVEQAAQRLERELPGLVEQAVERALAEGEEEE